jgi:hypothetical protein
MFKCATCQIQQAPCSGAPVRTAHNGPGRTGGVEHIGWNQPRNYRGSSSGYEASGTRHGFRRNIRLDMDGVTTDGVRQAGHSDGSFGAGAPVEGAGRAECVLG